MMALLTKLAEKTKTETTTNEDKKPAAKPITEQKQKPTSTSVWRGKAVSVAEEEPKKRKRLESSAHSSPRRGSRVAPEAKVSYEETVDISDSETQDVVCLGNRNEVKENEESEQEKKKTKIFHNEEVEAIQEVVKLEPASDASSDDTEIEMSKEPDTPRTKLKNISEGKMQEKGDEKANSDKKSEVHEEDDSDEEEEDAPENDG